MDEYIISNVNDNDIQILNANNINWYPDFIGGDNSDVCIDDKKEYLKAMRLLGRKI